MSLTDGFRLVASMAYGDYDEMEPDEALPEFYGNGWWVRPAYSVVTEGGSSYGITRMYRSRQPFGPYTLIANAPLGKPPYYDGPALFTGFNFAGGYWWVVTPPNSYITMPNGNEVEQYRLHFSDDLETWTEADIPMPSADNYFIYIEPVVQYHEPSATWWVGLNTRGGYLNDDPLNENPFRTWVASATSPGSTWTITQSNFGAISSDAPAAGYNRRREISQGSDSSRVELAAPPYLNDYSYTSGYFATNNGQNDGKCFRVETVVSAIYPAFYLSSPVPWYLYLSKRFESVMWHADSPTGPWTRTPLRTTTVDYNWSGSGGGYSGTSTVTVNYDTLPFSYSDSFYGIIVAHGDGDWILCGPVEAELVEGYAPTYWQIEGQTLYKSSGVPMDGPWSAYSAPFGKPSVIQYAEGWWVLLCTDGSWYYYLPDTLKVFVGTDLLSLTEVTSGIPTTEVHSPYLPGRHMGDGVWQLKVGDVSDFDYGTDYWLFSPSWNNYSVGGAFWGTQLK